MTTTTLPRQRGAFERTRDHWWWRDGWAPGARYLTWHLTFEDADALHRSAERAGSELRHVPGIDVVPTTWLHLTMTGVGFAPDVDPSMLESITTAGLETASRVAVAPLVFDRVFIYEEGLCLSATSSWLQEVKAALDEIVEVSGGPSADPGDIFYPHVSLGYFSGEISEQSLDAALDRAQLRSVTVPAPRLSLIELGRDEHIYTWKVVAQRVLAR